MTPSAKVLAVLEAVAQLFGEPGFRGCTLLNAAAEAQPGSAEELATKDLRTWLHELFGTLVTAAGYPDKLAAQLVMLYDGANISAQLDHNPAVAGAARDAAAALLDTAATALGRPS